ncbi:hypothetical protein GE09DRAFT_1229944 [Coniochaeta sp. 2T2.1]|nr:hypothetical protein GE09DRAFT_1229944 [Coniochaeta sp. 2T2.1]
MARHILFLLLAVPGLAQPTYDGNSQALVDIAPRADPVCSDYPWPPWSTTATPPKPTNIPGGAPPLPTDKGTAYLCSKPNWPDGSCKNLDWVDAACNSLKGTPFDGNTQGFGPSTGSCVLYSDYGCTAPIAGQTAVANPGSGSLGNVAQKVKAYSCRSSKTVTKPVTKGTIYLCSDKNQAWTSCQNPGWVSFSCLTLATQFKNSLYSLGPDAGACAIYSDANCASPMRDWLKVQNPGVEKFPFATSAGSIMCV